MKTNVLRSVMMCCMLLVATTMALAESFKLNTEIPSKVNDVYQYRKSFAQAAGMGSSSKSYSVSKSIATIGLGYWNYDGGENWGMQCSFLNYNGWAGEWNLRAYFEKYGNYNCDLALLGYSFGLSEFDNGALYLSFVAGPSIRKQEYYDYNDDEDKSKLFIDFYGSASLNLQLGEKFLIKAGYNLWSNQFKFKEEYNADGFYLAVGFGI